MQNAIKPIHTESDYEAALAKLTLLLDAREGSVAADQAEVLAILIEAYETEHYPVLPADPIDVIAFYMEQNNLTRADLGDLIGSRPRATEILNRTRGLPISASRALAKAWGLPLAILIGEGTPRQPPRPIEHQARARRTPATPRPTRRRRAFG